MQPLLTPDQVGEILGISSRTVNELCNRRKLRFIQVDAKHRRFTEEMVEEFIQSQTVPSEGQQQSRPRRQRSVSNDKPATKGGTPTLDTIKKEMEKWE